MSKEIFISSTPHETRLAIVEDEALTEIYYERENEYTLAGSIYNGRVTRVLPGMQSSFVDIGLERDAFLYITDFMEEAPDSEEFDTAPAGPRAPLLGNGEPSGEAVGRGEANGRGGDRGGRGRRGGRDRDRNQDRPGGTEATTQQPDGPSGEAAGNDADYAATGEIGEGAETGEGAAGADGGRRWRGRRGRRRGRGERPTGDVAGPAGDKPQGYSEVPGSGDDDAPSQPESGLEFDGQAGVQASYPSGDRGRRDNGRNRDGQRRDSQRPQRFPRGFEPSRNLYGVDSEESSSTGPIANAYPGEDDLGAGAEPIILPGESLSKYRKGGEEPSAPKLEQATPSNLAPPANLYTLAAGWDGGDVLPGETLSRRGASDLRDDSRPDSREGRNRSTREYDRGPRRDSRPGRDTHAEGHNNSRNELHSDAPATDVIAAAAIVEQGIESTAPGPAPVAETAEDLNRQSVTEAGVPAIAESSEAPAQSAPEQAIVEELQVEFEYEPESASASYRIDPVAPSEFRQSAPVLEPILEPTPRAQDEPVAEVAAAATTEPIAEAHDITAITATGEMISEPPQEVPVEIQESESQGLKPHLEQRMDGTAESVPLSGRATGFAPGHGVPAEEAFEEEDAEPHSIHASSIEEMDDLDEETVEGATDLGTMLREMSIDQITRTGPELEEEDDLDEDEDFEEDDLDEEELDEEDEAEEDDEGEIEQTESTEESGDHRDEAAAQTVREFDEAPGANANRGDVQQGATRQDHSADRRPGRRDGRRDGRRGRSERSERGDRSDRPRNTGGSGERSRFGHGGGGRGRSSMQATNLPAISDLLKPGQEILVQIAKEPIAKKGARITSHIALPGRFLVFMPTVNHTGVSRKIESDSERRRLKDILLSEKGDATGGFIVRTAAEGASEEELRSDLRFLLNLWADIKARSESSKSPALIYHDLNLIERILRDQVTDNFSAIWVDSESEYERVLRFLQRFQPSLIRRVKLYLKDTPLFEQFGITEEINKALRSKVWLKSGGSIVINQTEALVAIDINTGKYVGKTARLEDTIVKTNLDAIPEIVRQIRLRDLGGIIIIDFIDMDERKNRNRVMAALEDELKLDRAPSKVLQFNDFGLVAITRKRVKQSLERTLSTPCTVCEGTGMVKSPITVCNDIFIEMRKMHKTLERGDIMLRVHPEVVKQLKSSGAKWLLEMEEMVGKTILVKSDPALHPEQYEIH